MQDNKKLSLFISYSHNDEHHIDEFIKHIYPLNNNNVIDIWHDRKIIPGQKLQDKIDINLENSSIICLFISANFLASSACLKEQKIALKLMTEKGVAVVPIILSKCGWLDDANLPSLLALPTDGKAVEDHDKQNDAWYNIYEGLKLIIDQEIKIKQLEVTEQFSSFLHSSEMLAKAHSKKDRIILDDIFVDPELEQYDDLREYEKTESAENIINNFCKYSRVLIAGENQSGKTTLCKKLFINLRENNFFPVYVSDRGKQYQGKIENKISAAFHEQYKGMVLGEIDKKKIIPIIDDFHFAKNKEKHIRDLSQYQYQVVIVDDIFSLNLKDENFIRSFCHFKIKEFTPSLRNKLIEKWTNLTDKTKNNNENDAYQRIDNITEFVNDSLGKIIGSGIMPAYPFFILSIISTNETFGNSLDQEITSQGHCYQALIYLYLTKEGVTNEEIEIYINFLTEFAFFFYKEEKNILSKDEFCVFMELYLNQYNLPIEQEILLDKLQKTQIIILDSCNNYSFRYPYLYYFFVAKYLSEHIEEEEGNKKIIDNIIKNLHKDENSYIAIFISHHSKNNYILDEITLQAYCLFDNYKPAVLNKDEVSFFDNKLDIIINEILPPTNSTPEKERIKRLETQDEVEKINEHEEKSNSCEERNNLAIELRRSIKTVEVMGRIIKNRAGSLKKERLEAIFEEGMKVHLRILTLYFDLIRNEEVEFVNFISERIKKINENNAVQKKIEGKKIREPSNEELERLSKTIFWNINFFFIFGLINKIIHSLGSNKLTDVVTKVCDNENTPASFLVKHGILMWYNKNLQSENITSRIDKDGFSETAKRITKFMIVNHCSMHKIDFKQKQKIQNTLKISSQKLQRQSK